jgi:hypothetical protein
MVTPAAHPTNGLERGSSAIGADGPTPLEVPISGSANAARAAANVAVEAKPRGVAKAYIPKEDANTPPVVVDAAALKAGETAAQAEKQQRTRHRRSANAITIPGNVRVVPRGPGLPPTIERIDVEQEFAGLKPSRTPLVIGFVLLAGVAVAGGIFLMRDKPTPTKPAVTLEPAPVAPPPNRAVGAPGIGEATSAAPPAPEAPAEGPTPQGAEPSNGGPTSDAADAQAARKNGATTRTPVQHSGQQTPARKPPAKRSSGSSPAPSPAPAKGKGTIVRETPF